MASRSTDEPPPTTPETASVIRLKNLEAVPFFFSSLLG